MNVLCALCMVEMNGYKWRLMTTVTINDFFLCCMCGPASQCSAVLCVSFRVFFFLVVGNFLFSFCYTYHDEIVGIFGIQRIYFRRVI